MPELKMFTSTETNPEKV